jgi:signal transduction histidine kinase
VDRLSPNDTITLLEATLDAVRDAVVAIDLDRRVVAHNQRYDTVFGGTADPVPGHAARDPLWSAEVIGIARGAWPHIDNLDELRRSSEHIWSTLPEEFEVFVDAVRFKDGRVYERFVSPYRIAGKVAGIVASFREVSHRGLTDDQLWQSQKIEAIGRLAGGIAHDLNNALTTIAGYSDLALGQLAPSSPVRSDIEEIRRGAERAGSVTRQLLAFSRKERLEPRLFDLNQTIHAIGRLLSRLLGSDIVVVTELAPAVPSILGDPGQIEQAIINLAVNARDAMPQGGRLTLSTSVEDLDEAAARVNVPMGPGRYVVLRVSDTGHGMTGETVARIFEPFFTTKAPGKGTGLGLSMVYGTLKQIGGFIFADSEVGRGTTFRLYFRPAPHHGEPPSTPAIGAASAASSRAEPTLLVVEDEAAVRDLVAGALRRDGYRLLLARSAEEALELEAAHTGPIDLLLTDAIMPGKTGMELARTLRATRPNLRVIVMSGCAEDALSALDETLDVLKKPFSPGELRMRIRAATDQGAN